MEGAGQSGSNASSSGGGGGSGVDTTTDTNTDPGSGTGTGTSTGPDTGPAVGTGTGPATGTGTGTGTATGSSGGGTAGSSSSGGLGSGGSSEAGVSTVGSADGSAASGCAGKTYKLCEDFETGTVGQLPTNWTQYKGYGAASPQNVVLDNTQAHSGTMSLKSDDLGKSGAARAQRSLAALGATASNHWGRIFYKVQSPAPKPTGGVLHNTWTSLFGSMGEDRIVDTVENTGGMHQWLYNLPSDGCSEGSAYNWGYDTNWHCAEWNIDVANNSYRFFSDSTEVTSIGFTGKTCSMMSNPYTDIIVGSTSYQQPPSAWIMWFDDLAIDDTQIGCN